ncbi:FAD/NAD(P)-binding domain-containing protein [Pholiota conissans]|uniref:FAD/NAD(P)-binding domain-containing protein n=1 Tax=Pholiota conissans TaxID=109636 RepID=A0A9P5YY70_9AGAR|nr:FAD/NAD(P)-binding domain-containing protein [Pholiota conissans]
MSTSRGSQVVRIGIIGAGPAGLAALKTVLDTPQYKAGQWIPTVLEAREDVGGVWLPSDLLSNPRGASSKDKVPPTPLYDSLTTNLPHPVMAFSSYSFPPGTPLFPRAAAVRAYLADFASHFNLTPYIRFNTRVQSVGWDAGTRRWAVEVSAPLGNGSIREERHEFDMVLVCNGHHNVPRYPLVPGLQAWLDACLAIHSIFYRNPTASIPISDILHSTILVVGDGPSGQDVTSDLLGVAGKVILSSSANVSVPPNHSNENASTTSIVNKPRASNFDLEHKTATFTDGTSEKIDYCILATGYEVDFPFFNQDVQPNDAVSLSKFHLPKSLSSKIDIDSKHLTNSTWSVAPLVRHIIPFPGFASSNLISSLDESSPSPTSIAFLGLLVRVAPLPLLECQARAALAAFAHPSTMNSQWEKEERALSKRKETLVGKFQARPLEDSTAQTTTSTHQLEAFISQQWQRFEDEEQFAYRDALDVLAHELSLPHPHAAQSAALESEQPHKTKSWERELYARKGPLRAAWRALEASGEAPKWVDGVGRGESRGPDGTLHTPEEEWVELMWRVLAWGEMK